MKGHVKIDVLIFAAIFLPLAAYINHSGVGDMSITGKSYYEGGLAGLSEKENLKLDNTLTPKTNNKPKVKNKVKKEYYNSDSDFIESDNNLDSKTGLKNFDASVLDAKDNADSEMEVINSDADFEVVTDTTNQKNNF
jgi:hypothetical protein